MNLPSIIVLAVVAALCVLIIWLRHRSPSKGCGCGCGGCSGGPNCPHCGKK